MPGIVLSLCRVEVDWCRRKVACSVRLMSCPLPLRALTKGTVMRLRPIPRCSPLLPWLCLLALPYAIIGQEPPDTNYDESKVPEYELPDPLVGYDGRPITDSASWRESRRPEILRAFAQHVYGRTPAIKTRLRWEAIAPDTPLFGGLSMRIC